MKLRRIGSVTTAVFGLLVFHTPSHAVALVNSGFEDPPLAANQQFVNFTSAGQGLPGWTVTPAGVDVVNGPANGFAAYQGNQFLDLVGFGSTGGIVQTFAAVVGTSYLLTFAYSNNPNGPASASVNVTGAGSALSTSVSHSGASGGNPDWTIFSQSFIANSVLMTLAFDTTLASNNGGIFLDAVAITEATSPTPIPSALPLFGGGLAIVGLLARRKKRQGAARAAS